MDKCILFNDVVGKCGGLNDSIKCSGKDKECHFYKSCKEYTKDGNGYIKSLNPVEKKKEAKILNEWLSRY